MGERDPVPEAARALGVPLSGEAIASLGRYEELLRAVALPRGFVSRSDSGRLGERHVADSLRVVPHLGAGDGALVDLGAGAGLPGIPVAIARPDVGVLLVERVPRKAAFCELVVEELRLANVRVAAVSLERVDETFDVAIARALAPAGRAWSLARPLLRPGGRLIHFSGGAADPPGDLPGAAAIRAEPSRVLAHGGPLVIITAE